MVEMNMVEWKKTMMNCQQSCLEVNAQPVLVTFARSAGRMFTVTVDKHQLQEQNPATRAQFMRVIAAFWGPTSVVATVIVAANYLMQLGGKRIRATREATIAVVRTVEAFVVEDQCKLSELILNRPYLILKMNLCLKL